MSFASKLNRLGSPLTQKRTDDSPASAARSAVDRIISAEQSRLRETPRPEPTGLLGRVLRETAHVEPADIARALPGHRIQTRHGDVHSVDIYLEPHHCHGRAPVGRALRIDSKLVSKLALDPAFDHVDLSKMLLVDTETTGLNHGAGTLAFLVGIAFFEDQSLRVEQLLLTQMSDEPALLRHLADRIEAASCIVSYNGKSFDWPLLRTRFIMNRVPTPPLPPHLDLLHCSRRVFKRRLDSVRLVKMEQEVLEFHRAHDVSGAEIPGIYLHFLRSGDPGRLDGVIEHNGNDLIALAALLGELGRRFESVQRQDDPLDHLAFAKVAERAGDPRRARAFAEAAALGGGDAECTLEALLLAARIARRRGDVDEQERALLRALEAQPDSRAHLELSKLYEHKRKDFEQAMRHAQQSSPAETDAARDRRLARLQRRLDRELSRRCA